MTTRRRFIRGIGGLLVPAALARKADAGVLMMSGSRGVPTGGAGGDTALSSAVNSASSGGFAMFTTTNQADGDLLGAGSTYWAYSKRLIWDAVNNRLVHWGGAHIQAGQSEPNNFSSVCVYDEATNTWITSEVTPDQYNGGAHGYDEADIDDTGTLYYLLVSGPSLHKRTAAGTYSALASVPNINNFDRPLVFHPGLYSGAGGFLAADSTYLHSYRRSNNTWTQLAAGSVLGGGGYPYTGCYVDAHGAAYFGGASSTDVIKVLADGSYTTLTCPITLRNGSVGDGINDANILRTGNGKLIALSIGNNLYYTYSGTGTSWDGPNSIDLSFLQGPSYWCAVCEVPAHGAQLYPALVFFWLTSAGTDPSATGYVWRIPW